jgi:hypothetical protein
MLTKMWVGLARQAVRTNVEAPQSSVSFRFYNFDQVLSSSPYFIPVGQSIQITVRGQFSGISTSLFPLGDNSSAFLLPVFLDKPSVSFKELHHGGPSIAVRGLPSITDAHSTKLLGPVSGGDKVNITIPIWSMFLLDHSRLSIECFFDDISSGDAASCLNSSDFCISCTAPPSVSNRNTSSISIRLENFGILFPTNLHWTYLTTSCEIFAARPQAILYAGRSLTITVSGRNLFDGLLCNAENTSLPALFVNSETVECKLHVLRVTSHVDLTVTHDTTTCHGHLRILLSRAQILAVAPSIVSFNHHAAALITVVGSNFFAGINFFFGRFFECRSSSSSSSHVVCDVTFPSAGKHVVSSPLAFSSFSVFVSDFASTRLIPSKGLSFGGTVVTLSAVRGLPDEGKFSLLFSSSEQSSACHYTAASFSIVCSVPPSSQDCCSSPRKVSLKIGLDIIHSDFWKFL